MDWLDTKDILIQILMQGYAERGYGTQSMGTQLASTPVDKEHPIIAFYRGFGQAIFDRPLVTVVRQRAQVTPMWLGNIAYPRQGVSGWVESVPVNESYRIIFEATQNTAGISLIDVLVEQAQAILMEAFDVLITPLEAGGYSLYNPSWMIGEDSADAFSMLGGKVIYSSDIRFSATRFISTDRPSSPPASIAGFAVVVDDANAASAIPPEYFGISVTTRP